MKQFRLSVAMLTLLSAGMALAAHGASSTTPNRIAQAIENRSDTGEVRPGTAEPRVARAQILLDRARLSPGQIDGHYGGDLGVAIKGYQENHHLNPNGVIDTQTWRILDADKRPLLKTYTITAADLKGPFMAISNDVQEQARMKWMGYESAHFWNASPDEATAKLPPGPRNPVGVVWMGHSKAHYGIHGTPDPGRIRHGESYGCIRLTNWDAADLSHMVIRGTPTILEE
jgi:lipoprotein-anchoring transpeptidase ErfK/SrfK